MPGITSGVRPRTSPLRYPGGKGALYQRLRHVIRTNELAGCTYIEPYAGGAGAGISLLLTGQVDRIVLNDLDYAVYRFWRLVKDDPELLMKKTAGVPLSIDEWRRQREIYRLGRNADPNDLGFATFYLNRTNRSGVLNGGPIGGLDQTGNYKIDARFNRSNLIERIRVISLYSDRIAIRRMDGHKLIRRYVANQSAFIYADPPYFEKAGTLYMNSFSFSDHKRLAEVLNDNSGGARWLLTYDNHPAVDVLYGKRRRFHFGLNYSAHRVTIGREVAVISDALKPLQEGWPVGDGLDLRSGA